jgi:hypothetical protein
MKPVGETFVLFKKIFGMIQFSGYLAAIKVFQVYMIAMRLLGLKSSLISPSE